MRWVGQEDAGGCGAATLAMLCDCTYGEAKELVDGLLWQESGTLEYRPVNWHEGHPLTTYHLDRVLYMHGYYKQTRYASWGHDLGKPFAPVHYAMVVQPSHNYHFVVVLADGSVLDPLREGVYALSDWPVVYQVVGLAAAPSSVGTATPE